MPKYTSYPQFWEVPVQARNFVVALLSLSALYAQTGTGNIQGTVKDASGAVIPGAKVIVIQQDTARQYETAANLAGFYLTPSLPRGSYRVSVNAP